LRSNAPVTSQSDLAQRISPIRFSMLRRLRVMVLAANVF
jgi:hypothetical protein